jgi:hypothetical protein
MKGYFVGIFLLVAFCNFNLFAQKDKEEAISLQSLEFLNKQFILHLKKMNEPVLILTGEYKYVCNEYVDKNNLLPISRLRFQYEIKKTGESKYEFVLKVISEYRGTFNVVEDNDNYQFLNLEYVHISPSLISLPKER